VPYYELLVARSYVVVGPIAINKLFDWLFSRVLASHCGGLGSIFGRDMPVLVPLV
jgi:hypothetical protein